MNIHFKKITSIFAAGFILVTMTGCSSNTNIFKKEVEIVNSEGKNQNDKKENSSNGEILDNNIEKQDINNNINTNNNDNVISNETFDNENEVVSYFENLENKTNEILTREKVDNAKEKVTNFFVSTIDFIFYDKEIGGVTFDSLSNSAKLKILNISKRMDSSIEKKFPSYKEKIKSTSGKIYNTASSKIKDGINKLGEKTEEKIGEENYDNLQNGCEDMKDSFKNAGTHIKDGAVKVKDKVKTWYENKTGK